MPPILAEELEPSLISAPGSERLLGRPTGQKAVCAPLLSLPPNAGKWAAYLGAAQSVHRCGSMKDESVRDSKKRRNCLLYGIAGWITHLGKHSPFNVDKFSGTIISPLHC